MPENTSESEKKILEAAKTVFEEFGFSGARMQQIADEAGISKASLHYYFRSKENLFERIFDETMMEFMSIVSTWDNALENWEVKMRRFINDFFEFLKTNSLLFILREINRNPALLRKRPKKPKAGFISYFENLKAQGIIKKSMNVHLVYIFMHSLCSYPLINRSLFKHTTGLGEAEYNKFINDYPGHVADLLIDFIKKNKN